MPGVEKLRTLWGMGQRSRRQLLGLPWDLDIPTISVQDVRFPGVLHLQAERIHPP